MSNGILNIMREQFEQAKEFPAMIHCAGDLGRCNWCPVGFNIYNKNNDQESGVWACQWHIREDGEWLISKDEVVIDR